MRMVLIYFAAWIVGAIAYVVSLAMLWRQTISGGDLRAVLFWSALASAVAVAVVYAPVMFALRKWTRGTAGLVTYAITSVLLGVVPVLLIMLVFGGNLRSLMSPEAFLFYCMFTGFGLVFGAGFSLAYGQPRSA
jgi:hypothetical protein